MNALSKITSAPSAISIAHSVMAYNKATSRLAFELPIPLFLDTLALKIVEVPLEDVFGALSYPMTNRQIETFRFLVGLHVDLQQCEYYLEATELSALNMPEQRRKMIEELSKTTPTAMQRHRRRERISERELVFPTLRILDESRSSNWVSTTRLNESLAELFVPEGTDADILRGRSDTYFSQKVRNLISHKDQPSSFIYRGLAEYSEVEHSLRISELGRSAVKAVTGKY